MEETSAVLFDNLQKEGGNLVGAANGLCDEVLIELAPLHTAPGAHQGKRVAESA